MRFSENTTNTGIGDSSSYTALGIQLAMETAFDTLHSEFLSYSARFREDVSGTTATTALLFPDHIMLSHVGDSRAVLCCDERGKAIALTVDHSPDEPAERKRVERAGGTVSKDKQDRVMRVGGKLAVTRALGDRQFPNGVISHSPDTLFIKRPKHLDKPTGDNATAVHVFSSCKQWGEGDGKFDRANSGVIYAYDFLILASDGE